MRSNSAGFKVSERSKATVLPTIKADSNPRNHQSPIFRRLSEEDLLAPTSHDRVETWLFVQPEPNKHVQFARDVNKKDGRTSRLVFDIVDSLPDIDQSVPRLDLTPFHSIHSEIKNEDEAARNTDAHPATTSEVKLYRTISQKTVSVSSVSSSSTAHSRQVSFPTNHPPILHRPPSIEPSTSILSSSTTRDRILRLTSLEFSSSLSEHDRKKFDDIRQLVPNEFDQLLPTLLRLGVVLWPKQLFEDTELLTKKELKQRQHFLDVMEKDQQECERQRHLQRLYGGVLPADDILRKRHLLRENLSLQGQLALLESYRDEIENELTKKILAWRAVPMKSVRSTYSDDMSSINRSSSISSTSQAKQRFLQTLTSRTDRSSSNLDSFSHEEMFSLSLPDHIDSQWQRKSLVKIIEQGMTILDQVRKIPRPILTNQMYDYEVTGMEIVRTFKRWLFLWSTLYTEDKCLR